MFQLVVYSLQIFFIILDCVVLLYLLNPILLAIPFGYHLSQLILTLMLPMWMPAQYLIRHSILHTVKYDLSPYLLLLVLTYLQGLCSTLLNC